MKNRILVWDLPSRLIHWGFAASLTAAIAIGFLADEHQPVFQLHMLFGIVALFLLALRIISGLAGARYSRFSSFPLHPREVMAYLRSAVFAKTRLYAGNNPGSAVAAVLMFLLVPALFITGSGYAGHAGEELHETLAWMLIAVIGLHLAGLAWHTFRHRENIALAMVTGKKTGSPEDAIPSSHPVWGVLIAIAAAVWIAALFASHKPGSSTARLPGTGITLPLGENARSEANAARGHDDD